MRDSPPHSSRGLPACWLASLKDNRRYVGKPPSSCDVRCGRLFARIRSTCCHSVYVDSTTPRIVSHVRVRAQPSHPKVRQREKEGETVYPRQACFSWWRTALITSTLLDSAAGSRKRKRDTDDDGGNMTDKLTSEGGDIEDGREEDVEDEDEEDYSTLKFKAIRSRRQPMATGASKGRTKAPLVKKPRIAKTKGATGARKGKPDASIDVVKQIKDSLISDDNTIFSMCFPISCTSSRAIDKCYVDSILNPSTTLQSTAEDYLSSLSSTPSLALADLINCILRACGCNESVDSNQVMDSDGVVDVLDTFTEGLKQVRLLAFLPYTYAKHFFRQTLLYILLHPDCLFSRSFASSSLSFFTA